jgi:hypothetical protein
MQTTNPIKQHPILFSTPMVQAILEGRKTMTRRILKPSSQKQAEWLDPWLLNSANIVGLCRRHEGDGYGDFGVQLGHPKGGPLCWVKCPFGQVGDILWVRETFVRGVWGDGWTVSDPMYWYRADDNNGIDWHNEEKGEPGPIPWKPSIHMPYDACRLFLRITDIRVERLQDITEADAINEGIESKWNSFDENFIYRHYLKSNKYGPSSIHSFQTLWESINGEESWDKNPWVWVISFEHIEKPQES